MTGTEHQNTEELDWDRVYLLGWYDSKGRPYLSTWHGDLKRVEVVVSGFDPVRGPPLWSAPVPNGCKLLAIPSSAYSLEERIAYATSVGGVYAFGWITEDKIDRAPKRPTHETY